MASNKTKALMGIAKIVISLGFGYAVYYFWAAWRIATGKGLMPGESIEWAYAAGIICAVLVYVLLGKINKGGDAS
jgi:hypothetical protein